MLGVLSQQQKTNTGSLLPWDWSQVTWIPSSAFLLQWDLALFQDSGIHYFPKAYSGDCDGNSMTWCELKCFVSREWLSRYSLISLLNRIPGAVCLEDQSCISVNGWRKCNFKRCSLEFENSDDPALSWRQALNMSVILLLGKSLTCSGREHHSLLPLKLGRDSPEEALSHFLL